MTLQEKIEYMNHVAKQLMQELQECKESLILLEQVRVKNSDREEVEARA